MKRVLQSLQAGIFPTVNILICLYLLAPILVVIPVSFSNTEFIVFPPRGFSLRWYANFFTIPELTESLWLSVRLAIGITIVATTLGTMASIALVRHRFRGQQLIRSLVMAPMVLPSIVLGIGLLVFLARARLSGTFTGLFFAHLVLTLPYVIRTVSASLQGFELVLEEAAASLGASPLVVIRTVILPLVKPGVMAGAIFAFITSFDEVVVSIFLTGPRLSTLPVQIYNYVQYSSDPTIAAISVLLIVLTTTLVVLVDRFVGFTRFV